MRSTVSLSRASLLGVAVLLLSVVAGCTQPGQPSPSAPGGGSQPSAGAPAPTAQQTHLVAFSRGGRVGVMKPDGSQTAMLSAGPADYDPAWSPDGKMIAFARFYPSGQKGTYVMKSDGTDVKKIGPATPYQRPARWSPDSTRLLMNNPDPAQYGLWVYKVDGPGSQKVIDKGPIQSEAWSPDGKTIAFTLNPGPKTGGLYLVDVATIGSAEPKLALDAQKGTLWQAGGIAWSPDGASMSIRVQPFPAKPGDPIDPAYLQVLKTEKDGTVMVHHKVDAASGSWQPAWSPDGSKLAILQKGSGDKLKLATVATASGAVEVLTEDASLRSPVWAPDGSGLLVTRKPLDQPDGQVVRVSAKGMETANVAPGAGICFSPMAMALPKDQPAGPAAPSIRVAEVAWSGWN